MKRMGWCAAAILQCDGPDRMGRDGRKKYGRKNTRVPGIYYVLYGWHISQYGCVCCSCIHCPLFVQGCWVWAAILVTHMYCKMIDQNADRQISLRFWPCIRTLPYFHKYLFVMYAKYSTVIQFQWPQILH